MISAGGAEPELAWPVQSRGQLTSRNIAARFGGGLMKTGAAKILFLGKGVVVCRI
jgi:hypothetical protein